MKLKAPILAISPIIVSYEFETFGKMLKLPILLEFDNQNNVIAVVIKFSNNDL